MVIVRLRDGSKLTVSKQKFDAIKCRKGLVWMGKVAINTKDIVGHDYVKERREDGWKNG